MTSPTDQNNAYFRLAAGSLATAEFIAFTQLVTKASGEMGRLSVAAVVLFAVSLPLLVGTFIRPPTLGKTEHAIRDVIDLILFFGAVLLALASLSILFWSLAALAGVLFPLVCVVAACATFRRVGPVQCPQNTKPPETETQKSSDTDD